MTARVALLSDAAGERKIGPVMNDSVDRFAGDESLLVSPGADDNSRPGSGD